MNMIECKNIAFSYDSGATRVLDNISVDIEKGDIVAVLGHNGSGKSTLIKHLNALLKLQEGSLTVAGIDVNTNVDVWELRKNLGVVFQNPDNQFVASAVEDDVAFGLENYQVPRDQITERTRKALGRVGMTGFEKRLTHTLSGGQKQRVALAGVLAMDPDILVFDEATSMLDPEGRRDLLGYIKDLNLRLNKTIVMVTHYVEECFIANKIALMKEGKLLKFGEPVDILSDEELLLASGLKPPMPAQIYLDLKRKGIELDMCPLTEEELVEAICRLS